MSFKDFLYANRLKQVEIAKYLGVTEASVSRICKGITRLTEENLSKILTNPYNWDTSALTAEAPSISAGRNSVIVQGNNKVGTINNYTESPEVLKARIALLEKLLEEKERTIQILISQTNK